MLRHKIGLVCKRDHREVFAMSLASRMFIVCVVALTVLFDSAHAAAGDWPQFLGPSRNGSYQGEIAASFPQLGPKVLWKRKVGEGYGGPVVSGEMVVLFHRVGKEDVVECMKSSDGSSVWKLGYATRYFDPLGKGNGPRSTPAIADGYVVTFGAQGLLQCVDLKSGKLHWRVDTAKDFGSDKGFFGRACSPLISKGKVLLNIGGTKSAAGVGAFDLKKGKLLWKATSDEAGYSSPTVATIGQQDYAFFYTRTGLVAVDPADGKVLFTHRWRSEQHASVNAATPIVIGNRIALTSSYQTGGTVLAVSGKQFETLWSGDALSSQYVTPVYRGSGTGGQLFGFTGRHDFDDTKLTCVNFKTGKARWSKKMSGGPVVLAKDKLVVVTGDGELVIAKADADAYHELARARVLNGSVRAHPALVDGKLLARDGSQLICVDLSK